MRGYAPLSSLPPDPEWNERSATHRATVLVTGAVDRGLEGIDSTVSVAISPANSLGANTLLENEGLTESLFELLMGNGPFSQVNCGNSVHPDGSVLIETEVRTEQDVSGVKRPTDASYVKMIAACQEVAATVWNQLDPDNNIEDGLLAVAFASQPVLSSPEPVSRGSLTEEGTALRVLSKIKEDNLV